VLTPRFGILARLPPGSGGRSGGERIVGDLASRSRSGRETMRSAANSRDRDKIRVRPRKELRRFESGESASRQVRQPTSKLGARSNRPVWRSRGERHRKGELSRIITHHAAPRPFSSSDEVEIERLMSKSKVDRRTQVMFQRDRKSTCWKRQAKNIRRSSWPRREEERR